MIPKSLSASALQVWESCPARYVAETLHRTPNVSGKFADLGSACHTALEDYVRSVYVKQERDPSVSYLLDLLNEVWVRDYPTLPRDLFVDGQQMLQRWFLRSGNLSDGREILSLEQKRSFEIKTSAGAINFNYIFDRLDRHEDGSIEVVDYKSVRARIRPEGLKDKIQSRCYAVAAQILYPDAPRVWVTFDLLRYDPVGIVFSREENMATWRYIRRTAENIIATSEAAAPETVNAECRFCIRKQQCASLREHVDVGGVLALADPLEAAKERYRMENRVKALTAGIEELDSYILQQAEHDDTDSYEDNDVSVSIDTRTMRTVTDPARALAILGTRGDKYIGMTIANIMKAVKDEDLTDRERAELDALIGNKPGKPSIRVSVNNPID